MPRVEVDPLTPDPQVIAEAARLLRAGGLVAFPTETVYGLGANALDAAAVARIYAAKGRPAYNPLIVHVAQAEQALDVVREWPDRAARLAHRFWPGPLTMVLPKRPSVPDSVTAGLDSVAVRVPMHRVAHALLLAANIPVAAPSANISMSLSPTTGRHVAKSLGDKVDMILDAGPTPVGIESTVVDLTTPVATLLRPGTIALPELEAVLGPMAVGGTSDDTGARRSPGMLDRHYAPRARLILSSAGDLESAITRERMAGRTVGALVMTTALPTSDTVQLPHEPHEYAAQLYAALHALDDRGYDVIVVERVPSGPEWLGVRDRLERAAQ